MFLILVVFAEVFEEVLEIVSYMTFFSPTISLEMWSLWPLMMEALSDWAIDFFPSKFCGSSIVTLQPVMCFSSLYGAEEELIISVHLI